VLIGGALFAQSFYVLGLYAEGRMLGVITGGLGLLMLIALTLTPQLLIGGATDAEPLAETSVMKWVIMVWAVYAVAVGAHGVWELEERPIGFYSGFLVAATMVPFIYFVVELQPSYGDAVWLAMSGATVILTALAGLVFFYLAIPFNVLRLVAGWALMLGGGGVAIIGMAIVTTAITVS
jgi:hypothetical protein